MTELLPIQFRGVDEGADPKSQPPGTLLVAENCAMDKARRLIKRAGTTGLSKTVVGSTPIAAGKRLLAPGTAMTDGDAAYVYVSALTKWNAIDRPPALRATRRPLVDSTRSVTSCDVAIYGDMLVTAFLTSSAGAFVQVTSLSTGEQLYAPVALHLTTDGAPRVLVDGAGVAYIFVSTAAGTVLGWTLDLTTLTLTGPSTLVNAAAARSAIDVILSGNTLFLAYEKAAGASRTTITSFSTAFAATGFTISYVGTNIFQYCLAFGSQSGKVFLAFTVSGTGVASIVTATALLAAVAGPTVLYGSSPATGGVFIAEASATEVLVGGVFDSVGFSVGAANALFQTANYNSTSHAINSSKVRTTYDIFSVTKPWKVGTRWYVCAVLTLYASAISTAPMPDASSVVLEIEQDVSVSSVNHSTHPHVATLENQTGWAPFVTAPTFPKVATDSAGNVYIPAAFRHNEPANITVAVAVGWNLYKLAADLGDTFRCAQIGPGALCAGAAPFWFDGLSAMPYGFSHAPLIVKAIATASGTGLAVGSYSYVAVYTWRDANGVLHRSMPSPPVVGTTTGGNLWLTLTISTSSLSGKQRKTFGSAQANPILIEIYRTTVGATGAHYRLTYEPAHSILVNDPTTTDVVLIDKKPDSDITTGTALVALADQPQLYTDTGELADVPPPSLITVATHRGRLVGIGPDLRTLWFSKDSTTDATIAPGFNEALTLGFAHDKTAIASLDEKLIAFGEDTIDVVFGDGPSDAGDQNTWQIQALQSDVGCINPRSVVAAPPGTVFLSRRGLELLGRDLAVSWIGKVVEDTLAAFPTITSAVLVASAHEIRFTCNAANGATGIVLAFDYHHAIWFTRKYKDSSDTSAASIPFADAALVDGVYTLLTAAGQVYRETTAHKLDGGADFVARDVQLAPISPTDKMAWHRVKDVSILGTSVTDHDLQVSIARDYATTYEQTKTFLATSDATAIGPLEKCRVSLANQKCRAVKIRIRDLVPSAGALSTGDGPILEGLALRVAQKNGPAKTNAAERG